MSLQVNVNGAERSYLGLLQEAQEAKLLGAEDQQRVALAVDASGCPAHPVDVLL